MDNEINELLEGYIKRSKKKISDKWNLSSFPTKDASGQSGTISVRISPDIIRTASEFALSNKFTFKTVGDVYRALFYLGADMLSAISKLPRTERILQDAEEMKQIHDYEFRQAQYEEWSKKLKSVVAKFLSWGDDESILEARTFVKRARYKATKEPDRFWRNMKLNHIDETYSQLLEMKGRGVDMRPEAHSPD